MPTQPQKTAKFAILSHGHAGFPNRVKRSEGSDTTPASHAQKALSAGHTSHNFDRNKKTRSPTGPRRLRNSDAHKRIAVPQALCVLRERTPGQDPKAAKFAVLTPGPGMFVNVRNAPRVVIAALSGRPLFRRVSRCVRSCWRRRACIPAFTRESKRGPFCRPLRQELFCRVVPIDGSRGWVFVTAFERPLKSV